MKKFIAGYLFCNAIRSLYEDILGKDAFLKLVDDAWISAWYTVPMAIVSLIVAVALYRSKKPIIFD